MVSDAGSNFRLEPLLIFRGRSVIDDKLVEAEKAIQDGADDLDLSVIMRHLKNGDMIC
jgi:deoxyribose-phosphate aldolase